MRTIFGARKMDHAIDAGKSRASTTVSVWVELLFRQNITTLLRTKRIQLDNTERMARMDYTSVTKERIQLDLRECDGLSWRGGGARGQEMTVVQVLCFTGAGWNGKGRPVRARGQGRRPQ